MLGTQVYGKLLPTHQDIRPILDEIRANYQIPEITSDDNGLKALRRPHSQVDCQTVHHDILERLKDLPELPPTGKKVSVPDTLTVTVQGGKVSNINLDTPASTGIPAMIAQLAAKA